MTELPRKITDDPYGAAILIRRLITEQGAAYWRRYLLAFVLMGVSAGATALSAYVLGQVINKADTVAARRTAQLRYESIEVSEMVVRLYGNTAIVTARADVKGKELGEEFSGPYRFTRVWVRRSGHWLTVSYQATVTR